MTSKPSAMAQLRKKRRRIRRDPWAELLAALIAHIPSHETLAGGMVPKPLVAIDVPDPSNRFWAG